MPTVTYNGQSFAIDGRRVWVLGASMDYSRIPPGLWPQRVAAARRAGFNTIDTACPWSIHEPRKGRYSFDGEADVRRFIEVCGEAGMWVLLRVGPYVGDRFDGGGLPPWITEDPNITVREAGTFLERVTKYLRKLLSGVEDLQVTKGGPILLVQGEHAWTCSNDLQAEKYLGEVTRIIRESGVTVPIINTNDLWVESTGTIDTWRGREDMLVHLRQLRTLKSDAPRVVSAFRTAATEIWGDPEAAPSDDDGMVFDLAQVLAAGAQPVVRPFHAGTNFGFQGGRVPGRPDGFVTTRGVADAPLGQDGVPSAANGGVRRLMTFANDFAHVFTDLDPDDRPVVASLDEAEAPTGLSVVPQRGNNGRVVFLFSGRKRTSTRLLLEDGLQMDVELGKGRVGWYVFDADLHGSGRLDYSNLSPLAIIDRSIVVFFGPAKASAYISINGSPVEADVPAGSKPTVIEHRGLTLAILNEQQAEVAWPHDGELLVGVAGFDEDGRPLASTANGKAWVIRGGGEMESVTLEAGSVARTRARQAMLPGWDASPVSDRVNGRSARYANLDGPATLNTCGAPSGYGWYRLTVTTGSARKRLVYAPQAADRLAIYQDGALTHLVGRGPGAVDGPFELKLARGEQQLAVLADNLGRFDGGNDIVDRKGLFGHLYEVRPLRSIKPRSVEAPAVDPFELRGFIAGRAIQQHSGTDQLTWTVNHLRKTPILLSIRGATATGSLLLNDQPLAYYAGASGGCGLNLLLDPRETEAFKRGKNVIRFAPDVPQEGALSELRSALALYECVETLTAKAGWAFAKWEFPAASSYTEFTRGSGRSHRGTPCWWRCRFPAGSAAGASWLHMNGLSKGQVFINGDNLGRYFTATATGRAVGPQTALYVPPTWLSEDGDNELLVFDEHGFDPSKVKLTS